MSESDPFHADPMKYCLHCGASLERSNGPFRVLQVIEHGTGRLFILIVHDQCHRGMTDKELIDKLGLV